MINKRFGRLLVIEGARTSSGKWGWLCKCDCGNEKIVYRQNLGRYTNSCGCYRKERASKQKNIKHGLTNTVEHRAWIAMRVRCLNPKSEVYKNYGGRGITICSRWDKFTIFLADMGNRPDGCSLDRIDVNGNYEPSNCRWADLATQQANRRPRSEWHLSSRGSTAYKVKS